MRVSASTIGGFLTCPFKHFLYRVAGIEPKDTKKALAIGSAVHWGIEHKTDDLTEFFTDGSIRQKLERTEEQCIAEAVVTGYLKNKDSIFKAWGSAEELHEVFLETTLPNFVGGEPHKLVGFIDLILITDEGAVIIDYKTSSRVPDFEKYLSQIFTYVALFNANFPDIKLRELAIINLRKSGIRQGKTESREDWLKRLKNEHEFNSECYITVHRYKPELLDKEKQSEFFNSLSMSGDLIEIAEKFMCFPQNLGSCDNYGACEFKPLCTHMSGANFLYKTNRKVLCQSEKLDESRDVTKEEVENLLNLQRR